MTATKFKKGDLVQYQTPFGFVSAIVRRAHRDGSYTVEARFAHSKSGERDGGCYLGYRYRYEADILEPMA